MHYVSEHVIQKLVRQERVNAAIAHVFTAMAEGNARNFPVVRELLEHKGAVFGFKSGFAPNDALLGVKVGGYWPHNAAQGTPNHQSTVLLVDPDSGAPVAVVAAAYLTALRTAAASALSVRHLARQDAETLGILGAGGQSLTQVRAALSERDFQSVLICSRSPGPVDALISSLAASGVDAKSCDAATLARTSDVIITVTPSQHAIIKADWVQPGTHIACMGADTRGKQEVESSLMERARLFGDEPSQCVSIGECQSAYRDGTICQDDIVALGDVINGSVPGRTSPADITVFDSTGVGLQDLVAARLALDIAIEHDCAQELDNAPR